MYSLDLIFSIEELSFDFLCEFCLLQDYMAKLSDFGLAKAGPQGDETHVSTRVMGTYGYAAPEYVMTGNTKYILFPCTMLPFYISQLLKLIISYWKLMG